MVDMVVDISESVPLMPSQRLRLMLSMVLLAMVVLDILATLPLAIAVDMDMDVDLDIMVKYFQSIEDEFANDFPNTNTLQQFYGFINIYFLQMNDDNFSVLECIYLFSLFLQINTYKKCIEYVL